jgi:hypothetical protein
MLRRNSLERLARLAEWGALDRDSTLTEGLALVAAEEHGANALRAIKETLRHAYTERGWECSPSKRAVSESRLAVHSALAACGFRLTIDGHHNL